MLKESYEKSLCVAGKRRQKTQNDHLITLIKRKCTFFYKKKHGAGVKNKAITPLIRH